MTGNILPTNLEATRIIFGRTDGSVISDNLKLKENGEIFPALLNEAYWAIREGTLHFLNSKRETTTIFDKVVRDDEIIEYHGKFL
ncbi:hypothetical protein [Acidiphilium acidophilum]|uniref:hypothetical protein n=1 Tax=Acidiphilium acidophilum TaxID=76588 RepID=UPI002E8E6A7C|nr:hypothetical protein [Acidiphilium acidophilum]